MNKKNLIFLLIILILSILFYLNKNLFLAKLDNSTVVDSSVVGIVGEKTEHYDDNFVLINEKTVEEKNKEKRLSFMDFVFICEKVDKDYGSFSTENINCDVYYKDSFLKTFENVLIYYNKDFRMISFYENGLGGSFLNTRYIINGNDELVEMPGIIPQHGSAISYAYDINKNFIVVYKISDFNSEFVSYDIYNKEGELIPEDYLNCYFAYLDDQVVNFSANCKYRDVVINHSKRKNFGETVESKIKKESFESSLIIPQENS